MYKILYSEGIPSYKTVNKSETSKHPSVEPGEGSLTNTPRSPFEGRLNREQRESLVELEKLQAGIKNLQAIDAEFSRQANMQANIARLNRLLAENPGLDLNSNSNARLDINDSTSSQPVSQNFADTQSRLAELRAKKAEIIARLTSLKLSENLVGMIPHGSGFPSNTTGLQKMIASENQTPGEGGSFWQADTQPGIDNPPAYVIAHGNINQGGEHYTQIPTPQQKDYQNWLVSQSGGGGSAHSNTEQNPTSPVSVPTQDYITFVRSQMGLGDSYPVKFYSCYAGDMLSQQAAELKGVEFLPVSGKQKLSIDETALEQGETSMATVS